MDRRPRDTGRKKYAGTDISEAGDVGAPRHCGLRYIARIVNINRIGVPCTPCQTENHIKY